MQRIILASASPQRKRLLSELGVEFEVIPDETPESNCTETDPAERSKALAKMKADNIYQNNSDAYVIGCDTLVVSQDSELLEKAADADGAREMLKKQSGGVSVVHSALCVIAPDGSKYEGLSSSKVFFKSLSDDDLDWWISTGLWEDRSGSFQIDGSGH